MLYPHGPRYCAYLADTQRLGPEKDREVEEQVHLVQQDLVEPGGGAWTSLVVLVWKKDQSWHDEA